MKLLELYQSSHTSQTARSAYQSILAMRLASVNARTPSIVALTGISEGRAREVIRDVTGKKPKPGRVLDPNLDGYVKNRSHRIQISILITNYLKAISYEIDHVNALISAYKLYLVGAPIDDKRAFIEFDHAFQLVSAVALHKTHVLVRCGDCLSKVFTSKTELFSEKFCPFCSKTSAQTELAILPTGQQLSLFAA